MKMAEEANNFEDLDEELGGDFANLIAALQRTQHEESAVVNKSLLREKEKSNEDTAHKASLKYLEMEAEAVGYKEKYKKLPVDLLEEQISQQKTCLINRDAFKFTIQNLYTQGQLQETRNRIIDSRQSSEELSHEFTDFLKSSTACFKSKETFNKVLEENAQKKAAILFKRKRLAELQKNVTELWQNLETKDQSRNKRDEHEDIKSAREKLKSREARLYMVCHYVITLLACLSDNWGKDKKTVNIIRACEHFRAQPAMTDFDSILKVLQQQT